MAEVTFNIHYYMTTGGKEWDEIPEADLQLVLRTCQLNIALTFEGQTFQASEVDLVEVDTYSEIPGEFQARGFDAFADVSLSFDIDDHLLEAASIEFNESESEDFAEDIDAVLGEGVYQVTSDMPISRPLFLQVLE